MADEQRYDDEILLIDFALDRCDEALSRQVRQRLTGDAALRRLHDDIRNTFAAMDLSVEADPPEGLVERTLARLRSARETDALLAREELSRRDVIRPTFSLREAGAIAGVVLLLLSVFGVSYREARRRQDRTQCGARVARLGAGLLTYANQNRKYLPAAGETPNRNWLPKASQPAVSNSRALFPLLRRGYVEPTAFQCPAVGGRSFVVRAGMTDFPHPESITYSYQYSIGMPGLWMEDRKLVGVKMSMAILADGTPLFPNGRFRADRVRAPVSDNHDGWGQNVLYLDMHVEFQRRASVGVHGDNIYLSQGIYEYDGDEAPAGPTDTFLLPAFSNVGSYQVEPRSVQPKPQ